MGILAAALLLASVSGQLAARRYQNSDVRYYARKIARYTVAAVIRVALAVLWGAFAGRIG